MIPVSSAGRNVYYHKSVIHMKEAIADIKGYFRCDLIVAVLLKHMLLDIVLQ